MLKRIFKISITIAISIISAFAFIIAISMMIDAFKNAKEIENLYFCDYEDYKGNTFMEGVISKDIDELQTTLLTAESIDELDNITLIINKCKSAGLPPKGVDLQNPITKKSLWPLVFNS